MAKTNAMAYAAAFEPEDDETPEEVEVVSLKDQTDDELAERRNDISLEIAELKRQDELLKAERMDINQEFLRRFEERGSTATRTTRFTISAREDDIYPEVFDRQVFEEYVLENKMLHLFQKRLALGSVQEELAAGNVIPGIRVTTKMTINQRKRD